MNRICYRSESQNSSLMQDALPARLVAEGASLDSGWDTLLEGTQFKTSLSGAAIRAGVGEEAKADAKILFKGIVSRTETQQAGRNRSALWQKTRGSGTVAESLRLPAFDGPAPEFGAPGGYIADIPEGRLKDEIEKLAAQPGHEYLKQLQAAQNTDWNKVRLAYDNWDYAQSGLTGGGAALITVIVTALTYGAASGAAAGATGTAATTTTTAAGTTVAGTTVTTGGIAAGAGTAALAALNSKAAVSLINNKGDLGKTLKELGRSDTVKTLVSAAVTAGIAEKLGAAADWNGRNQSWQNRLTTNLATAGSTALANSAIHGGSLSDGLEKAVLNALVQSGHTEASLKIKGIDNSYIAHKIAHAAAGCAAGAANRGSCADGAIGAAVGEIVGEAMLDGRDAGSLSDAERQKILGTSKVIAGSVAALSGGDVDTAANAAQVAVVNNALSASPDEAKYEAELDALWADSGADSNRYYQGVQKIAERDGLALDVLLTWVPAGTAAKAGMGYAARTAMMERRTGIANIFNSSTGSMKLGGTELKEIAQAANRSNTTRVFDASKVSDAKLRKEVFEYAEKLGGGKLNERVPGQIWNIKTVDGATINVRSKATKALPDGSKPRWTIEIVNDQKLRTMIHDKASMTNRPREIKFK